MTGIDKIFLDTNILVYFLDRKSLFHKQAKTVFERCFKQNITIGISTLAITEYLVDIYKHTKSDLDFFMFLEAANVEIYSYDIHVATRCAKLRAHHDKKLPDLIHIATALENNFKYFLTNDKSLKNVIDVSVLNLEKFSEVVEA